MATLVLGETVIFKVWDGSSAYIPAICLTENSLSETKEMIESQTKCNPGVIIKTPSTYSYEISLEGEYGYDPDTPSATMQWDDLRAKLQAGTRMSWSMEGFNDGSSPVVYYGDGYLTDIEFSAPAGASISTFSATLSGNGIIVTTEPSIKY